MKEQEFYSRSGEFPVKGSSRKATSGTGSNTAKGTVNFDIDFEKLYGASTDPGDKQFQTSILTESGGLPDAAPKTGNSKNSNSKGKKGY